MRLSVYLEGAINRRKPLVCQEGSKEDKHDSFSSSRLPDSESRSYSNLRQERIVRSEVDSQITLPGICDFAGHIAMHSW